MTYERFEILMDGVVVQRGCHCRADAETAKDAFESAYPDSTVRVRGYLISDGGVK